ncbi:MAG: hypothetical protein KDA79_16915, partial [Planctomycetaceae bacterium]|nr:hypothetical protein [Planctomycetaceae bacterium]
MSRHPLQARHHLCCLLFALAATVAGALPCAAEEHREGFDSPETSWQLRLEPSQCRPLSHRRHEHIYVRGTRSENVEFVVSRQGAQIEIEHALPASRVVDELTASVWVRSNRSGLSVNLRVIFPYQKDPRTSKVLSTWVTGERYSRAGKWQQISCQTTEKQLQQQIRRLRHQLNNPKLDSRGAYVDRVILAGSYETGAVEVFIDELTFSPVIRPGTEVTVAGSTGREDQGPPVEFRLDQLLVEGRPWFPRLAAWHEEDLNTLKSSGVNLVWVPSYEDSDLLGQLRQQGLWAIATPPRARQFDGRILQAASAGLMPLREDTSSILFWYEGTRIPASARYELVAWNQQIRSADKYQRPLMADVSGMERVYSKQMDMLGISRHMLHTTFSFRDYRNWLLERRRLARPGTFTWTWLQTEPASATAGERQLAHQTPVVVEPEQIRLQLYSALAAGCRGVGFWKTTPLDSDAPGADERRLIISQLNLELQLIDSWLATGTVIDQVSCKVQPEGAPLISRRQLDFRNAPNEQAERAALLRERQNQLAKAARRPQELEATVIRSDDGLLLLPVWYEEGAQYVPGQMAAHDATIIVPGVDQTASAWEVSTTGIRSLPREPATGGVKLTLPRFDQTAMILLTANRKVVTQLRARIAAMAPESARMSIELTRRKLARVEAVDAELRRLSVSQPDAPQILYRTRQMIDQADVALGRQDYGGARELADGAMQLIRILQRAHWEDAIRHQNSPVSSPHTLCFQTLPEHWKMIARLGRSSFRNQQNMLRSGGFEDFDTLVVEGWKHMQSEVEGIDTVAELYPGAGRDSRYGLRLVAAPSPEEEAPAVVEKSPVAVTTPPVPVRAGQLVYISGWIRVVTPVRGNPDGLMIFDSLTGPSGAIRFREQQDWQQFSMLREVHASGDLRLSIVLSGLGDVHLDDLTIVPHSFPVKPEDGNLPGAVQADSSQPSRGRFDFLGRLPRLSSPFRSDEGTRSAERPDS